MLEELYPQVGDVMLKFVIIIVGIGIVTKNEHQKNTITNVSHIRDRPSFSILWLN